MAFRMNRPMIKGTPLHKASIVASAEQGPDARLIQAGEDLGVSHYIKNIDFGIDSPVKPVKPKKKEEEEEGGKGKKPKRWSSKDTQEVIDNNEAIRISEAEKRYQEDKNKKK